MEKLVDIVYLCDGGQCGSDICNTECSHTSNIEHALHKDNLRECLFEPIIDEGGNIISFWEINKESED